MNDENLSRMWDHFLDAAKNGTKKGRTRSYKYNVCKVAQKLSDTLIEQGYICGDRYELWLDNFGKICMVLEGNNDVIQRIVREYFLTLHSGDISEFSIKFSDKTDGTSSGTVCEVNFSGSYHRLYIKCHQRGPRSSSLSISTPFTSVNSPLVQELFIYKLLSLIGVGGDVHYLFPISSTNKKALYIATEEVHFTIAKNMKLESANPSAMILVYFLQCILRLEDIATNGGNYGQSRDGKPVIVDFWVFPKENYALSDAHIHDFWGDLRNCNSRLIADAVKHMTKEKRREVIQEAIDEWQFLLRIDEAKTFVNEFVTKNGEKLEVSGDLNSYIRDINSNVVRMLIQDE